MPAAANADAASQASSLVATSHIVYAQQNAPDAPATVVPDNVEAGTCNSVVPNVCIIEFTMGEGIATSSFLFSNGHTSKTETTCTPSEAPCVVEARGVSTLQYEVLSWSVSGPNIRNAHEVS
jgi:hypothetical protein